MSAINLNSATITNKNNFYWLLLITAVITSIRFYLITLNLWPINGDEAQYWNWSQHLAFGYYSKPPLLGWLISITSRIFGDGVLGIRLASPLCHAGTSMVIYLIANRLYNNRVAFWSGLTYLLTPGVIFSSDFISTDPPLLLFWSLSLYFFVLASDENKLWQWFALGVALGLAMLSKYAAIFIPISCLLYLLTRQDKRHLLSEKGFYISLLMMLVLLLPNIIWNVQNAFVTVIAVKDNADLTGSLFHIGKLFEFLASQIALFGPILFISLIAIMVRWQVISKDPRTQLLLIFILPLFATIALGAFLSRANANWVAPIYIAGTILVCAYLILMNQARWLYVSLCFSLVVFVGFFFSPSIIRSIGMKLPLQTTTLNWEAVGQQIQQAHAQYPGTKLLVNDRMLMALSMYYGKFPLADSYKWNLNGTVKDQYELMTHLTNQLGSDFILVSYYPYPFEIFNSFKVRKLVTTLEEPTIDGRTMTIYIYYLGDFLGYSKASPSP